MCNAHGGETYGERNDPEGEEQRAKDHSAAAIAHPLKEEGKAAEECDEGGECHEARE